MEADGRKPLHVIVRPDLALRFCSLKNGDIVQVTVGGDGASVDEFYHVRRANGSKPRLAADFRSGAGQLPAGRAGWPPEI